MRLLMTSLDKKNDSHHIYENNTIISKNRQLSVDDFINPYSCNPELRY
jgi:hypothetical protein